MLFNTLPQFVVLGLLLFGGLILGLGLHPGGKKWRRALDQESEDYADYRRDADGKLREANGRIAELERENATLTEREAKARALIAELEAKPAPVAVVAAPMIVEPTPEPVVEPIVETAPEIVAAPVEAEVVEVAEAETATEEPKKEWFSMGGNDDVARIRSIDEPLKAKLTGLGVTSFADVEKLSAEDEIALEQRLDVPAGFIAREQWRDQAALLRAGKTEEHRARFWANN